MATNFLGAVVVAVAHILGRYSQPFEVVVVASSTGEAYLNPEP